MNTLLSNALRVTTLAFLSLAAVGCAAGGLQEEEADDDGIEEPEAVGESTDALRNAGYAWLISGSTVCEGWQYWTPEGTIRLPKGVTFVSGKASLYSAGGRYFSSSSLRKYNQYYNASFANPGYRGRGYMKFTVTGTAGGKTSTTTCKTGTFDLFS